MKALEEEQRLIDLLRADDLGQASKQDAERRRQKSQALRMQMAEANRVQIQLKVLTIFVICNSKHSGILANSLALSSTGLWRRSQI